MAVPAPLARMGFAALWHPELIAASLVIAALYLWAARGVARRGYTPPTTAQRVYFLLGIALLYLAVGSPLDALSDNFLFSAHMLEHILIGMAVPPLLLLGLPDGFWRVLFRQGAIRRTVGFLTRPILALFLFNIAFSVYHFPYLYDLGLSNGAWHFFEHAVLFVTGLIMWWPIIAPSQELPRISAPAKMVYLFVDAILMTPVFAVVLFAPKPLYSFYLHVPRLFGLSPLADQQLGAVIMKLGVLVTYGTAAGVIFFDWIHKEALRERESMLAVYSSDSPEPVRVVRQGDSGKRDPILERELS